MAFLDSAFPSAPDFVLLDLGPGEGRYAELLSRTRRVVTVELDETLARRLAQRSTSRQLVCCRGDAQHLPVRTASVDAVLTLELLEHVENPDTVLQEAFRVLKPSGVLCVAVPTSYTEGLYSRLHPRYMDNAAHVRVFKKIE